MKLTSSKTSTVVSINLDLTLEMYEVAYLQQALEEMMLSDFADEDKYTYVQKVFYIQLLETIAQAAITAPEQR
jgi:hypothetical protein